MLSAPTRRADATLGPVGKAELLSNYISHWATRADLHLTVTADADRRTAMRRRSRSTRTSYNNVDAVPDEVGP